MLARTLAALCAVALLIPGVAGRARADSNTGVVRGYVYLENSKRPVCGIRVTAEANNQPTQTTYTDRQGYFVFISRFPGIVRVTADDPSPRAKAYADVHPALLTEPILYVSSRHTSRHRCAT